MVAERSVTVPRLTTALAQITSGTENIEQALSTLKHDLEGEAALAGVNSNTKATEGISLQIANNFEQVKHAIGINVEMAKQIDVMQKWMQAADSENKNCTKITAGVSEQLASALDKISPSSRGSGDTKKGIDGKASALAANTLTILGKERHEYVEWNSKVINAMGWLSRPLGRELKETMRAANREWSQPAFKEKVRDGATIETVRDHFEGVTKKIINAAIPRASLSEQSSKVDIFMERFDDMEPVLDYWFHLKTVGDNAVKVREATNAWVVYYQIHKRYTEATGQMVQE